jgi:hypothetical protein
MRNAIPLLSIVLLPVAVYAQNAKAPPTRLSVVETLSRARTCDSQQRSCLFKVGAGSVFVQWQSEGSLLIIEGNLTDYRVMSLGGDCVRISRSKTDDAAFISILSSRISKDSDACAEDRLTVKPTLENDSNAAINPCDRPRPYRNWSNAELNAALVRYMDGDKKILQQLIDEAACRA